MNEQLRLFYQEELKKIDPALLWFYEIVHYTIGHRQLIVRVEAEIELSKDSSKLFIVFEGVQYVQLPTRWKGIPFELTSSHVHQRLLEQIDIKGSISFKLAFSASSAQKDMFIVCSNMYITANMPKLYEYSDDAEV